MPVRIVCVCECLCVCAREVRARVRGEAGRAAAYLWIIGCNEGESAA